MTYREDIVSLARELERLKGSSVDVVAATKDIEAVVPLASEQKIVLNEQPSMPRQLPNQVHLQIKNYGSYPLTHHGSLQLADKCGIPRKYYEAMIEAGMANLTAENVNAWLSKQSDRRLVRIADGRIRALLSDRYRALDNYDLAMLTMERAKGHNATVQRCDLTETRMYLKFVVPHYREEIKAGDPVVPGLVVSNSDVGDGAFRVEPFVFRLVCSNGLIGETSLYKVHLGQRMEIGNLIYRDDTRKAVDEALWKQCRDVIDSTFNREVLRAFIQKLRKAQELPIENPVEVVDVTATELTLSEEKKTDLLRYFSKEGDTVFGLVQGITQLAQNFEGYEDQVRLERYAGEVLEQKVPHFESSK
jgi:hypothetical protein